MNSDSESESDAGTANNHDVDLNANKSDNDAETDDSGEFVIHEGTFTTDETTDPSPSYSLEDSNIVLQSPDSEPSTSIAAHAISTLGEVSGSTSGLPSVDLETTATTLKTTIVR